MLDSSLLGGGYAESEPDPGPTVEAVLAAAQSGSSSSQLVVLCGPPGVGKSAAASRILQYLPHCFLVEKDITASGFILLAAEDRKESSSNAYGTAHYWAELRPREYAGATALACANLIGNRSVLLVGGWGPELSVPRLWTELQTSLAPSRLTVLHMDPPPLDVWRTRLSERGSRSDPASFDAFAAAVTAHTVWEGAVRISTDQPLNRVVEDIMKTIGSEV